MTTYELIQKLAQYPADAQVTMAHDWSEPILNDEYLAIPGDPTLTLCSSGWALHPSELARLQSLAGA